MANTGAPSQTPAPKPARQPLGCMAFLGYAYGVFVLIVVGVVVFAHYKKKEVASWALDEMSASVVTSFLERYDLEQDPLYVAASEEANADKTLNPTRRGNLLEKKRADIQTQRSEELEKLRARLVKAHEDGKIGEAEVTELRAILEWAQDVTNAEEKPDHERYEEFRSRLESFLARVEVEQA